MKVLSRLLDAMRPTFDSGGKLERLHPFFEAADTFFYNPKDVAAGQVHVRDALDFKRLMGIVVVALVGCIAMAMYNTGLQAARAIAAGATPIAGWPASIFAELGFSHDPSNIVACVTYGALHFLPMLAVTFVVGLGTEVVFAVVRRHTVSEGFFVTGFLFPLILPPAIPLWQVAVGIAFGVIFAKEVFGGSGKNFLNPALAARAFLFFAYPAQISGDVWVAAESTVDVVTNATSLAALSSGDVVVADLDFWAAFIGTTQGSMGETSALFCLFGAGVMLFTGVASWRTLLGVAVGSLGVALLLNTTGSTTNPMMNVPPHWHFVLGGWAFGAVFMATDPVTSAYTDSGKLIYGFGIGALAILIRCVNPAYPEGMMLAILFMNLFAPLIDHIVVQLHLRRRAVRLAKRRDRVGAGG